MSYTPKALRQLRDFDRETAIRIEQFLSVRVATSDDPYALAKAFTGPFKGQYRFRVGDYRIICKLVREQLLVSVLSMGHRKEIYD